MSFLYHALQRAQTYARYASEAGRLGDEELVEFFQEYQVEDVDRAERAKELLAARLDRMSADSGNGKDEESRKAKGAAHEVSDAFREVTGV